MESAASFAYAGASPPTLSTVVSELAAELHSSISVNPTARPVAEMLDAYLACAVGGEILAQTV